MQAEQLFEGAARSGVFGLSAVKARQGDVLEVRVNKNLEFSILWLDVSFATCAC